MRELCKKYSTEELNVLFDTTIKSAHPLSKEQAELVHEIIKELTARGEMQGYSDEKADDNYFLLLKKYKEVTDSLPEDADTLDVVQAVFQRSAEEELLAFRASFFPNENEKLSGRDADPPRAKPKIKFLRPALIAAAVVLALFLTNVASLTIGYDFFGSLARWSRDAVYFVFGESDEITRGDHSAYRPLADIIKNLCIEVDLPTHIPEGFEFDAIEPAEPVDYLQIITWFVRGDEEFSINITPMGATNTSTERNDEEQSEYFYKGKYLIETNIDRFVALWYQNGYEIRIQGDLTYEELIKILNSI